MIKIAIISDIHANLPALKAVIHNARKSGAMMIWNLGDNCGYGPYPNEVIKLICAECEYNLQGNYDKKVIKYAGLKKNMPSHLSKDKKIAFAWAWNELTDDNRKMIAELPEQITTFISSYKVIMVHGSPELNSEGIDENTPTIRLKALLKVSKSDIIICGHTHKQFYKQIGKRHIINPGSVGRPDDNDPRAAYMMLSIDDDDNIDVEMHRIEYDTTMIISEINRRNLPSSFISIFSQGLPLHLINTISEPKTSNELINEIQEYLLSINADIRHSIQVSNLANIIFNQLYPLHNLDNSASEILAYSALLHDIGWATGNDNHHKRSAELIRGTKISFTSIERELTAQISRYHRKNPPSIQHSAFAALPHEDKIRVKILSAILRVADALDVCHEQKISDINCRITRTKIYIYLISEKNPQQNIDAAIIKGQFMTKLFNRTLIFSWKKSKKTIL